MLSSPPYSFCPAASYSSEGLAGAIDKVSDRADDHHEDEDDDGYK
jgi:hypothetical protein